MPRGRPVRSDIRQHVVDILQYLKVGYGYQIAKIHNQIFPKVTREVIYYHLRKGVKLGEFEIERVAKEKGDYSWGGEVEKIYYVLGKNALTHSNKRIEEFLKTKKKE